jgi:hypothetical protein
MRHRLLRRISGLAFVLRRTVPENARRTQRQRSISATECATCFAFDLGFLPPNVQPLHIRG